MNISKQTLVAEFIDVKNVLVRFFKNPVVEIGNVPDWQWPKLIVFLALYSAVCGVMTGAIEKRIAFMFGYFFMNPITAFAMTGISTLFFAIFFKIFANRDLSWRHLFTVIVFANLPHFLLITIETFLPPIVMVGLVVTSLLLIKGFVEIFSLDKKLVIKVVGGLYIAFFLWWAASEIITTEKDKRHTSDDDRAPEVMLSK